MGSKQNKAKRNSRKANKWKGIVKLRKDKIRKDKICKLLSHSRSNYDQKGELQIESSFTETDDYNSNNTHGGAEAGNYNSNNMFQSSCIMTHGQTKGNNSQSRLENSSQELGCSSNWLQSVGVYISNNISHISERESSDRPTTQDDTMSVMSFDFDEWIETDYNYVENGDSQGGNEIETPNSSHSESDHAHEIDYDNGATHEETTSQNESIHLQEEYENEDIHLRDESENLESGDIPFPENKNTLNGRRIVDIDLLFEQMRSLFERHSVGCDSRMEFVKETKMGLRSLFYFQCSNCGLHQKVESSAKNEDSMPVNKAATLGIMSIGSGFYHMEEFFAHLDIPCMSTTTFDIENKKLQKDWWKLAKDHQEKALLEEIKLAISRGDVDINGNALLAVVCDGSWGKRSYGKGFSSLSGCAAIIGLHTKKVVYFGVKNKHCNICTKSYAKFCPPNDHPCNINYYGPSSGMETEIIVEGFKFCERLGARFHKMIADGDSSAYKEISDSFIYQNPDLEVEKLECGNHLFKNFHKKFIALCDDTKYKLEYRKLIKPSIGEEISKGVRMAAKHWQESNLNMIQKLNNFESDCMNAPYHCLGIHKNCNRYFCQKTTSAQSKARIDSLKSSGLFYKILTYCSIYFVSNARSIIEDYTTNSAEELNNVIAKYLGGKRINYSLAGSYQSRVAAAVVQYNSKGHAGSELHKNLNYSCLKVDKMENSRLTHYAKNEAARQAKPRKRAKKDKPSTIKGYGGEKPDLVGSALEVAKNCQLAKLEKNRVDRHSILLRTYGQKHCSYWYDVRRKLINCTYFGRIVNARNPKSYRKLLEDMLYTKPEFGNSAEVRHQCQYELEALQLFSSIYKKHELVQTGIFIDKELNFLGASPLRLYGSNSIVIVKCPVKAFLKTVDEAVSKKLIPFSKQGCGDTSLNVNSNMYIEAQGELHVTGRKLAYLVVWLGTELIIDKVRVDHVFWKNQMEEKLKFFFNEAMIKELADPRRGIRKMKLREFDANTNSFI